MSGEKGDKRLERPRAGRMATGVCAGLGDYLGVDPNIVRLIWAVATLISAGAGAVAYLVAWLVIPEEGQSQSIAEDYLHKGDGS